MFDQALAGGGAKSINFQVHTYKLLCRHPLSLQAGLNFGHAIRQKHARLSREAVHKLSVLQDLAADLAQITFDYPFSIPPYFALIIRAIGVLEGIALVGNPGVRLTSG